MYKIYLFLLVFLVAGCSYVEKKIDDEFIEQNKTEDMVKPSEETLINLATNYEKHKRSKNAQEFDVSLIEVCQIPDLWEKMEMLLFLYKESDTKQRNYAIFYKDKIHYFGSRLLSVIVNDNFVYFTAYFGSGVEYSQIGKFMKSGDNFNIKYFHGFKNSCWFYLMNSDNDVQVYEGFGFGLAGYEDKSMVTEIGLMDDRDDTIAIIQNDSSEIILSPTIEKVKIIQ